MVLHASVFMSPIRGLRSFVNNLGVAWWAKVETNTPSVTYWYGPFLTRRSLKLNLANFEDDLSTEGSDSVKHTFFGGKSFKNSLNLRWNVETVTVSRG